MKTFANTRIIPVPPCGIQNTMHSRIISMPPCSNRNTRTFQDNPNATLWQSKHPYILELSHCHLLAIETPVHTRIIPVPPFGNQNTHTYQDHPSATLWQSKHPYVFCHPIAALLLLKHPYMLGSSYATLWQSKHPYILGSSQCHLVGIKTPLHTGIITVPPCGNGNTPYILGSCQSHLVAIEKVIHSRIIPVPPCENQIVRPYQDHSTATFLLAAINTYQDYHSVSILLDLLLNINIAKISVNLISHQSFKIKSKCMYMYLSVYCTEMKHQNYSCSQSRRKENDL